MTYVGRRDHFECDTCHKKADVSGGLPTGWVWVKNGIGQAITHACEVCKELINKEQSRVAGEKN